MSQPTTNWVIGAADAYLYYSTDGSTWLPGSGSLLNGTPQASYGVACDGSGTWIAIGEEGNIAWSVGGTEWSDASGSLGGGGDYYGVAYGLDADKKPLFVAVGNADDSGNTIMHSPDGKTWTFASGSFDGGGGGYYGASAAFGIDHSGNNLWIAVGCGEYSDIKTSVDGKSWYDVSDSLVGGGGDLYGYSVAFGYTPQGSPMWITTGDNNTLWSTNGKKWNNSSGHPFGYDVGGGTGFGITYNRSLWVAVGGTNSKIRYSPDGITWLDTSGTLLENTWYGIASDASGWIAVGSGTPYILYSSNGMNWPAGPTFGQTVYCIASTRVLFPIPSNLPCFLQGTRILTPAGYKRVEEIESGDLVLTSDGRSVKASIYRFTIDYSTKETAPYCIQAGALGDYLPSRDLHISGNHAIQDAKRSWQIPKYLAKKNTQIQQHSLGSSVIYYHVECPNYMRDNIVAEGVTAESFNQKKKVVWKRTETGYGRRLQTDARPIPFRPKK